VVAGARAATNEGNDPTRLLALEIVPDDPCLALRLEDLVLVDAEACLLVRDGGDRVRAA
jgi:hypothetical protein